METLKFKTTIKCSGCVMQAAPFLNKAVGDVNWNVDVANKDKILTVVKDNEKTEEQVLKAIIDAGYKAEKII